MNNIFTIGACVFIVTAIGAWFLFKATLKAAAGYERKIISTAHYGLEEMFLFVDSRRLFYLIIALAILGGALTWFISSSGAFTFLVATLFFIAPKFIVRWLTTRRLNQLMVQLPDALMMVSGALRAGSSLNSALASVAAEARPPISQEFALLMREQRLGMSLDNSLDNMAKRIPAPDFILVLSAIKIAREVGGNLAETLERLANTLRQKASMEGKINSLTAQGKLQGIVIGLLPLALAIVLCWMDPASMASLFNTPVGLMVCAAIVVLEILGATFIRKVVTIDV
ncbi:MAG: type II secretion system F family protein [Pseudomonadota bacterium]